MITFERVPEYIRMRHASWKTDTTFGRKDWLRRAQESEEYYYNDVDNTSSLFTAAQKEIISKNTNIPVSINFLHPVCNQKLAILAQTKPSTRTVSVDGRGKNHALVIDKMKHGVFYTSNAQLEIESMIKDMLITGMGAVMVAPADFYQKGMFNVRLAYVPFDEIILDINAKRRDLNDMEGFFIERQFTTPKALQLYGNVLSEIRDENGRPVSIETFTSITSTWVEGEVTEKARVTTTNWDQDSKIDVREYYEKVFTTMYLVENPDTGLIEYLFEENLDLDQQALLATAKDRIADVYIKKCVILGDYKIWEEILPITEYPLKVTFFEWGGRPYRSYGMIHFTKDMQEAFDKVIQLMILNGILSNNAGWTAPKGTIPEQDRKKWEDHGSNPMVIKEYVPKEIAGNLLKPEKEQITQLSNFYPTILEMMKQGIEYSTGINPIIQGDAGSAGVEVFSTLQQYQNAAMMRIQMSASHLQSTMKDIGQVLVQYLVANLSPDEYHFFDEQGNLNELTIAKEVVNDLKIQRYMVVSIPSTAMPTQRLAVATEMMKIAQSSPDSVERSIYTQTALSLSDLREFDQIQEKIDVTKRVQGQLQQMQEAYDRLTETSKQMENKLVNTQIENRILKRLAKEEVGIVEAYATAGAEIELAKEKAKLSAKPKQ